MVLLINSDINRYIPVKYLKNLQSYLGNDFIYTTEPTQEIAPIIYFIYHFSWITTFFGYDSELTQ